MKKETVLINGCSTGLGLDLFKSLDKKKYNILGLTSKIKIIKKNINYYNPRKEINLSQTIGFKIIFKKK